MTIASTIISAGLAAVAFIFVLVFVYLASKWGIKRTKEISKRFDNELKELEHKENELKDTRKQIVDLKIRKRKLIKKKDFKKAKMLEKEIKELEKIKDNLMKEVDSV